MPREAQLRQHIFCKNVFSAVRGPAAQCLFCESVCDMGHILFTFLVGTTKDLSRNDLKPDWSYSDLEFVAVNLLL